MSSDSSDEDESVISVASRRSCMAFGKRSHHANHRPRRRRLQPKPPKSPQFRPSADTFATILLCAEENSHYARGMPMFQHMHSKITQDVCNAIFLCKVKERKKRKKSNFAVERKKEKRKKERKKWDLLVININFCVS